MKKYLFQASLAGMAVTMILVASCGDSDDKKQKVSHAQDGEVIIQNPSPTDLIRWKGTSQFYQKNISLVSNSNSLEIGDISPTRTGWVLWSLKKIAPSQNYNIILKIKKRYIRKHYSQIQVKFLVGKTHPAKYFYVFVPETGKVITQQQATKEMARVEDTGEGWILHLKAKSPQKNSTMQLMILPAVGNKMPTGFLDIRSIEVTKG